MLCAHKPPQVSIFDADTRAAATWTRVHGAVRPAAWTKTKVASHSNTAERMSEGGGREERELRRGGGVGEGESVQTLGLRNLSARVTV